jgi:putative oxidoreductase
LLVVKTLRQTIERSIMDEGLLIGRVVLGLMMTAHGTQKLLGWFGGYGLDGTGGFFEQLGFRPGRLFAAVASLGETAGGLLMALGLLGPVGPAVVLAVMIVAAITVHWPHGLFATNNGIEVPLLYATGAVALIFTGPGRYSLDALLGLLTVWTPGLSWAALAVGIVGGVASLSARRTLAPSAA